MTVERQEPEAAYEALIAKAAAAHRERVAELNADEARWRALKLGVLRGDDRERPGWRSRIAWVGPALVIVAVAVAAVIFSPLQRDYEASSSAPPTSEATAPPIGIEAVGHGAVIRTEDAKRELTIEGGHMIRLGPASRLIVERLDGVKAVLRLAYGEATFVVAPRRAGERFEVLVGAHKVSVRGTVFTVWRDADGIGVMVHEGYVSVRSGNQTRSLLDGQRWETGASSDYLDMEEEEDDDASAATEPRGGPPAAAAGDSQEQPEVSEHGPSVEADEAPMNDSGERRRARRRGPRVVEREVAAAADGEPFAVEPLSPSVREALLEKLRKGRCDTAEKALKTLVGAHGPATPGEVWWMRAWCARQGGDLRVSRRWFERARGKVDWPIPDDASLPIVPLR